MRVKNALLLSCVAVGAVALYLLLALLTMPSLHAIGPEGIWSLVAIVLFPPVCSSFIAGAVLCFIIDSQVPLKWCLGLGLLFACLDAMAVLVTSAGVSPLGFPGETILLFIAPLIGGYVAKRSKAKP